MQQITVILVSPIRRQPTKVYVWQSSSNLAWKFAVGCIKDSSNSTAESGGEISCP
jgi:hypothetical protein